MEEQNQKHFSYHVFAHAFQVSTAVRKNFIFCDNIDECLQRLHNDEYLAVALSRLHAENNPRISRSDLFCFSRANNVYTYSVAMPLKLDYELIESISTIIGNLMEFGLIDRWIKLSEGPTIRSLVIDVKAQHHEEEHTKEQPNGNVVLTMDHIIGALLIMSFGYLLAMIAFLVEQIVHQREQQGTDSKLFLYLHQVFSPNRIDCTITQFSVNNL